MLASTEVGSWKSVNCLRHKCSRYTRICSQVASVQRWGGEAGWGEGSAVIDYSSCFSLMTNRCVISMDHPQVFLFSLVPGHVTSYLPPSPGKLVFKDDLSPCYKFLFVVSENMDTFGRPLGRVSWV